MSSVIQDSRTALANAVTAAGLKCLEHEGWDIPTQTPVATLTLDSATPENSYDQGFGFRTLVFLLRVYQQVHGPNAEQSMTYQDASLHLVLTALGADRTIGGKFTNTNILSLNAFFERIGNVAYSVGEFQVEVTPFPNVG